MPLHSLAYCSQIVSGVTVEQIERLTEDAAAHNHIAGVTGVLFCDGVSFLQYIEGPADGVASAYARILNAKSHHEIMELGRGRGGVRRFPYWSMRWIPVEQPDLRIAANSEWRGLGQRRADSMFLPPTGVDRMVTLVRPYLS